MANTKSRSSLLKTRLTENKIAEIKHKALLEVEALRFENDIVKAIKEAEDGQLVEYKKP